MRLSFRKLPPRSLLVADSMRGVGEVKTDENGN